MTKQEHDITFLFIDYDVNIFDDVTPRILWRYLLLANWKYTMTQSYPNEMHDLIGVNLCHSQS